MSGLFAKVGLDILDHPKFHAAEDAAPGAVALWLWLTLHSRKHETSGVVPLAIAKKSSFAKMGHFDSCLSALAKHDLVYADGESITVARYSEHNETKEDIAGRRAAAAARQAKYRNALVTRDSPVTNANVTTRERALVTVSDSDSDSDSSSGSGESARGGPSMALHKDASVIAACEMAGFPLPTVADVIAMDANYAKNGRVSSDWGKSLISWMGNAKRFDAQVKGKVSTSPVSRKGNGVQPVDPGPFTEQPWEIAK